MICKERKFAKFYKEMISPTAPNSYSWNTKRTCKQVNVPHFGLLVCNLHHKIPE